MEGDESLKTRVDIRPAVVDDLESLASLIDEFAIGHPAEGLQRSREKLKLAYFGERPLGEYLLAVTPEDVVGYAGWAMIYDSLWGFFGGRPTGLYVRPAHRGKGIAAMLITAMCARIREEGG